VIDDAKRWYEAAMRQRLVLCLLGACLMGSLMLFAVAPKNSHLTDDLLASSSNRLSTTPPSSWVMARSWSCCATWRPSSTACSFPGGT
jgi:hypothetical protein